MMATNKDDGFGEETGETERPGKEEKLQLYNKHAIINT
jgi:hypothetical protein